MKIQSVPNIRKNFVVTDKADGDRHLLYVNIRRLVRFILINTNMDVNIYRCENQ